MWFVRSVHTSSQLSGVAYLCAPRWTYETKNGKKNRSHILETVPAEYSASDVQIVIITSSDKRAHVLSIIVYT